MKEVENCLDPQLWHACAGGMVQMPPVNSKVYYFPQGHIEHAQVNVDYKTYPKLAAYVPCRIASIKYLADGETDEVFAKIRLIPMRNNEIDFLDDGLVGGSELEGPEKPASFAKTLTQSDANNGGGFSVPRYCAETIFPRLDYSAEPPVQTILAKDVHGVVWKFRHIYRGTPRRHLLTTGWSNFVNQKKLIAGDSIVFLRADNGELCVGIRRAKRGIGGGPESSCGWNGNCGSPYAGGYSAFLRDDSINGLSSISNGKVRPESVMEAATLAANWQPFEVVYYPRASTPEFCVKASALRAAMQIQWCAGMRFKMAFETEDSSRISWFMGTISLVQVADRIHWPNSPWRLLQVAWDEPDLLQNVKRVNPWLVELVASMPTIHISPFASPRKKLRLPQSSEYPSFADQQLPMPSNPNPLRPIGSPLYCVSDNNISPAGIQGSRHAQFGPSSLPDHHPHHHHHHLLNKLQSPVFPPTFHKPSYGGGPTPTSRFSSGSFLSRPGPPNNKTDEDLACLLTIGNQSMDSKRNNESKTAKFVLFGKPILTEEQISQSSSSGDSLGISASDCRTTGTGKNYLSDGSNGPIDSSSDTTDGVPKTKLGLETGGGGHCSSRGIIMEPKELAVFGSYEEMYMKLADKFGLEKSSRMMSNVPYREWSSAASAASGDKQPFSEFLKTAKRLTVVGGDAGSENLAR